MSRRSKFQSFRRRPPHRSNLRRVLLLCVGAKTERDYLSGLKQDARERGNCSLVVREVPPKKLLPAAAAAIDGESEYDEIWCVCDVEVDRDKRASARRLVEAIERLDESASAYVRACLSNPCFELWLLLHFTNSVGSNRRPRQVIKDLNKYWKQVSSKPRYEKNDPDLYTKLRNLQETALKNAVELACNQRNRTTGDPVALSCNPCTEMHHLIQSVLGNGDRK